MALARVAAQSMRIAAEAGDIWRLSTDLDRLKAALDSFPPRAFLGQSEANAALSSEQSTLATAKRKMDWILLYALRVVASRLEENQIQEARSESGFRDAIRRHERERHERARLAREQFRPARRSKKPSTRTDHADARPAVSV